MQKQSAELSSGVNLSNDNLLLPKSWKLQTFLQAEEKADQEVITRLFTASQTGHLQTKLLRKDVLRMRPTCLVI